VIDHPEIIAAIRSGSPSGARQAKRLLDHVNALIRSTPRETDEER
jgi:hypothetical protein